MPMAVLIRVNLLFYIIFYFTCPIMRYISFALCALNKDQFYSSLFLRKAPIQDTIFPLFEELNQTTWSAHCPPPPLHLKKWFSSGHVMSLLRRVKSCSAKTQTYLNKPPSTMSYMKRRFRMSSLLYHLQYFLLMKQYIRLYIFILI